MRDSSEDNDSEVVLVMGRSVVTEIKGSVEMVGSKVESVMTSTNSALIGKVDIVEERVYTV